MYYHIQNLALFGKMFTIYLVCSGKQTRIQMITLEYKIFVFCMQLD